MWRWRGEGAFTAKGEFSGSIVTFDPIDLASGHSVLCPFQYMCCQSKHCSVSLEGPDPRMNPCPSVVLLVEDDSYFLESI